MSKKIHILSRILIICIAWSFWCEANCFSQSSDPSIRFLGAAQMVGGSCYLIDTGNTRILIDFGLFHGQEYQEENSRISFDPASIDFILLTHAHSDHAGRIPFLYKKGFTGKTIGTDATKSLCRVTLKTNLKLAKNQGESACDVDDLRQMMRNFVAAPYRRILNLNPDISVRFLPSGHILGSSIIEIWIKAQGKTIKLVATGDLGNERLPLLSAPDIVHEADYVLVESTAGPIQRAEPDFDRFGKTVQETLNAGGSVLIPAFALDRTQMLLHIVGQLKHQGIIAEDTPVYVDSSTARKVTAIYRKYTPYLTSDAFPPAAPYGRPLMFPHLYELSPRESLKTHDGGQPAIYISSSAMLDHANAPRHLEKMIEDSKNLLVIVGWQAPGTPGWKLQQGTKKIQIPVEFRRDGKTEVQYIEKSVRMRIKTFDIFSYHADGCQILKWLSHFSKMKEVFVVHGEKEHAVRMAGVITDRLGFKASAPAMGEIARISSLSKDYTAKKIVDVCSGMSPSIPLQRDTDW